MSDTTRSGAAAPGSEPDERPLVSRFTMEVVTAAFTAAVGAATMVGANEYSIGWGDAGPEPGYFPFWIGLILALASLGALAQVLVPALRGRHRRDEVFLTRPQALRVAAFAVPVALFVPLALVAGLYVATAIYLFVMMIWQGGYAWWRSLAVAAAVPVLLFLLFEWCFQVPLLKGPLEAALGIY